MATNTPFTIQNFDNYAPTTMPSEQLRVQSSICNTKSGQSSFGKYSACNKTTGILPRWFSTWHAIRHASTLWLLIALLFGRLLLRIKINLRANIVLHQPDLFPLSPPPPNHRNLIFGTCIYSYRTSYLNTQSLIGIHTCYLCKFFQVCFKG